MKQSKTILAILLISMMLVLTACGGAENPSGGGNSSGGTNSGDPAVSNTNVGGPGRYVETDVTPEGENILDMLQLRDGTIVLFTEGLTARYDSTDGGKTFQKSEWPGVTDGSADNVYRLAMWDDGTVYGIRSDELEVNMDLVRVTAEGTVESVPNAEIDRMRSEGKNPYIYNVQMLAQDKMLLGVMDDSGMSPSTDILEDEDEEEDAQAAGSGTFSFGGDRDDVIAVFDAETGSKVYDLPQDLDLRSAAVHENELYVFGYDDGISVRDLATGNEVRKIQAPVPEEEEGAYGTQFSFSMGMGTLSADGKAYTQDSKGVYRQDLETGQKEQIFDAAAHSFGLAQNDTMRFYALPDDAFMMRVRENNGSKIYRYAYDENAKADPDKVLEVWALEDNGTVRAAISSFLRSNPDATVNLTIGRENQGAQETADIIQNLNTKILAGDGPDILLLDGLPAASYAEKGMLKDLKDLIDFSGAYEQLLTPLETNGSLYYFPAKFKTSLLLTTADQMESFRDLESMVQAIENGADKPTLMLDSGDPFGSIPKEDRPVFELSDFDELFSALYHTSAGNMLENGKLNTQAVRTFLSALKRISDKYKLTDETEDSGGMAVIMSGGSVEDEMLAGNATSYMSGRALAGSFTLGSLNYLSLFESEGTEYMVTPGLTEGAYRPTTMMGISAGTDKTELAAAFLQNMFSEDVQGIFGGGFPMTGKGFDAQLKELAEMTVYGMETNAVTFDMQAFISLLKTPVITDQVLMDAVKEGAQAHCKGEMDLDAAVTGIEEATKLYLAEQS